MANVQVRDVPDDVLTRLRAEAARQGLSLQRYLRDLLRAQAGIISNNKSSTRLAPNSTGYPRSRKARPLRSSGKAARSATGRSASPNDRAYHRLRLQTRPVLLDAGR